MSGPTPTVTRSDRMLRALRALVAAETPRLTFACIYEYSVQSSTGSACDVSPTDTTLNLPALQGIPLRLSAMTATPAAGQKVLVFFVNGDPTRPAIFNTDPIPTSAAIDAAGTMTIGASSGTVNIGAAPQTLAHAASVTSALSAINTAFAAVLTYANTIQSVADPSHAATSTLSTAMVTVSGAINTAAVAIPTTVLKGT